MNEENTFEKYYYECLMFNKIAEYPVDEQKFDRDTAQEALRNLYGLYEQGIASGQFQRDKDYMILAVDVMQIISENENSSNYKAWRIWLRYFVSMGYDSWNRLWSIIRKIAI